MNKREEMLEKLTEEEVDILERVAKLLSVDVSDIYHHWTRLDTIEALVKVIENGPSK